MRQLRNAFVIIFNEWLQNISHFSILWSWKWNEMNSLDAIYFGNAFTTRVAQGVIQKEEREGEREGVEVKTLQRCWQQLNAVLASVIDIHLMCRAQCALSGNEGSHAPSRWVWQEIEREDYHQPVIFISITWAIFYTREGWEGCSGLLERRRSRDIKGKAACKTLLEQAGEVKVLY